MRRVTAVLLATVACVAPLRAQVGLRISVGQNVQVSAGHADDAHYEVLIAGDPKDASRMIVGSFRFPAGTMHNETVVYASRDGGRSWEPTLEGDVLANTSDPAPAYGPDGWAYYTASSLGPAGTAREARRMLMFRSGDGGLNWQGPTEFTYSDRQYVVVDGTGGKYHNRIYVNGNNRVPYGISDFVVFRSTDRGLTFAGPGTREGFGKHSAGTMGNAAIASDGTLIGVFEENGDMRAITSRDGGESLMQAVNIDTAYVQPGNRKGGTNNNVTALPMMAIDPGSAAFGDAVYAVWADRRSGRSRIFISATSDKGATWTPSRQVDDPPAADSADNFMPNVAVNRDGVVGVMWYDRRAHGDNIGWDVRFAASHDGGRTFSPSVKVASQGMTFGTATRYGTLRASATRPKAADGGGVTLDVGLNNFTFLGGDTAGLIADAAGVFHPVWVDNRTGIPQVWTAPVTVAAAVAKVAGADVSDKLIIDVVKAAFDRGTGELAVDVRLRNTSEAAVRGPFTVHVRKATSDIGEVRGVIDTAAFADTLLAPGASSATQSWRFTLADLQPFRSGNRYRLGLLKLNAQILSGQ